MGHKEYWCDIMSCLGPPDGLFMEKFCDALIADNIPYDTGKMIVIHACLVGQAPQLAWAWARAWALGCCDWNRHGCCDWHGQGVAPVTG